MFFSKILFKIKITFFIICLWALCYSANTVMKNSIVFEYDGGIADSSYSFQALAKDNIKRESTDYWAKLNAYADKDNPKTVAAIMCLAAKALGIKIYILCDREKENSETLINAWKHMAHEIHFAPDPNDRYVFLENRRPLFYAASSDENIIQAIKAEITPVRIKRNNKSSLPGSYSPGKFGETVIPFSQ